LSEILLKFVKGFKRMDYM